MFKSLGQRHEAKKQKSKQLWGRDFNIVKDGLDEEQVVSFVSDLMEQQEASPPTSVRSVLKTAIVEAEQIVTSIKMRAQAEAEEEAARIITQANQEAKEIKGRSETAVGKGESAQLQEEAAGEQKEEPAQSREEVTVSEPVEAAGEQKEEPVQPPEEAAVSEPVEATEEETLEQRSPKERRGKEETEPSLPEPDSQSLYTGEVELTIAKPVDPSMVSKLYNYLQTTPEIKFARTSGSWDRGTTITVVLDKPIPLISVLSSKIPGIEVTPELPRKDSFVKREKGVRRITLSRKERQDT